MTEPESARESTVHNQDEDSGAHARPWRAHTRDTVPNPGATVIDITQRSRERIGERWGKPIEEPPPDPPVDDDTRPRLRDALVHLRTFKASPSVRAIWADMVDGGARAYETGGVPAAAIYWAFGGPGIALVVAAELLKFVAARPGREAAALFIVLLVWLALVVAGLNPIPIF